MLDTVVEQLQFLGALCRLTDDDDACRADRSLRRIAAGLADLARPPT
jgi:hypothetical protein